MSAGEDRAREMERLGHDMSWYWRAKARQQKDDEPELDPDATPSGEACSNITLYFIEYHHQSTTECYAHIFTVKTGTGAKHRLHQQRRTQKTGEPVWWCSACGVVFQNWDDADGHWIPKRAEPAA